MGRERKSGFTLIEMLVVISIIGILAAILMPALGAVRRSAKIAVTKSLLANIEGALETYSTDFSGSYPPDTIDSAPVTYNSLALKNTAQCICYHLESEMLSDDGRKSGPYLVFKASNKRYGGQNPPKADMETYTDPPFTLTSPPIKLRLSYDFIIDAFRGPVVYDERKSELDLDGLNYESFVLVSGGAEDKDKANNLAVLDGGDVSMFTGDFKGDTIDTIRSDYQDQIPNTNSGTNDDIVNQ